MSYPKVNLTEDALNILRAKLQPSELLALELLSEGQKMTTSVTKVALSSIICPLVMKLKWDQPDEEGSDDIEERHEEEKNHTEDSHEKTHTEENLSSAQCEKRFERQFKCRTCDIRFTSKLIR